MTVLAEPLEPTTLRVEAPVDSAGPLTHVVLDRWVSQSDPAVTLRVPTWLPAPRAWAGSLDAVGAKKVPTIATSSLQSRAEVAEVDPAAVEPAVGADCPAVLDDGLSDLVVRLQAGDHASWRTVTDSYRGLVSAAARRVLPAPADVDEVVQRTWLALWRHADAVRDLNRLPGWLCVTARREALAILRRRREVLVGDVAMLDSGARSRSEHGMELWSEGSARASQDSGTLVERRQQVRDLHAAVQRLPERQRRLVSALLTDRMSYDELSKNLGIPRGSIGPMRARALVTLRTMLHDWAD